MEVLLHGDILLVGEGDFSFAVSVVEKLPSDKYRSILATSLETDQTVKKHQHAVKNILLLQEKGVTVRLETDATQLHVNPGTSALMFDCIIFNFPHAGGKSNHKKNRKLLNDFFSSAVHVLKKHGQILMTLCKGQGGTPADQPMRAWHDSWQVVSMAANSGFILTKVLPFRAEDYTVYTSTGFRSLDKGFHTENALTHVFETAEPVNVPSEVEKVTIRFGTHVVSCSPYIYMKLKQIRSVNTNKNHPVHRIYESIMQYLETSAGNLKVKSLGIQAPVHTVAKTADKNQSAVGLGICSSASQLGNWEKLDLNEIDDMNDLLCKRTVTDFNEEVCFVNLSDPMNIFESGMCENIQAAYVPVHKPCHISVNQSPMSYHIAIEWPIIIDQGNSNSLQNSLMKIVLDKTNKFTDILNNVISKSDCKVQLLSLKDALIFSENLGQSLHITDIIISPTNKPSDTDTGVQEKKEAVIVGKCHVKVTGDRTCPCEAVVYLTADLCKLACYRYSIEDDRLLWSHDTRVLDQFTKLTSEQYQDNVAKFEQNSCHKLSQTDVLRSPSLYPMTFSHDMSFWESQSLAFNELDYCNIIRDVAGDCVTHVDLIDTYTDPVSEKCSRCYRLKFQSADKVLSYDTSWKLQSLIRLEVEKRMKIELR